MREKYPWVDGLSKLLNYDTAQVHGTNQIGVNLATSLYRKLSIRGIQGPTLTMLLREVSTFEFQMNPPKSFGMRVEVRWRTDAPLSLADMTAIVVDYKDFSAAAATSKDFGFEFVDATAYDKLENFARTFLISLPLWSGFSSSETVTDSHQNPFRIVQRQRMQNGAYAILTAGGTVVSARKSDIKHSDDPKSLARITDLGFRVILTDFGLSKVKLRVGDHGETGKIANKVRKLLEKLKTKYTTVDLVPVASRLFELGHPVTANLKEAVTGDSDGAADLVKDWVVEALAAQAQIESKEQKLSDKREKKMGTWTVDKFAAVENIHEELTESTQLARCNGGGKNRIPNYYLMRKVTMKPTNNAGRGGDTGGQVGVFKIQGGWAEKWRKWSKTKQKEATGQRAEHHWQLAEFIFDNDLEDEYVSSLKEQKFWQRP